MIKVNEYKSQLLQEMSGVGMWEYDINTKKIWASDQSFRIYGVFDIENNFDSSLAMTYATPESKRIIFNGIDNLIKFGMSYNFDFEIHRADTHEKRVLNTKAKMVYDDFGKPKKVFGVIKDVTIERKNQKALQKSKENFEIALDENPIPMILHSEDGIILKVNQACLDATGYSKEELKTVDDWTRLVHKDRKEYNDQFIRANFEQGVTIQGEEEIVYTKSNEERLWAFYNSNLSMLDEDKKMIITVGIDVTEKKQLILSLERSNYIDHLTGVYNRKQFEKYIKEIDVKEKHPITFLFGDINGLKLVNDTFGHHKGDELLIYASKVMMSCLKDEERLFRIGGDEFAIVIPNSTNTRANELIRDITRKTKEKENKHDFLELSISFGYAFKPSTNHPVYDAIKEADDYMYRTKVLESKGYSRSAINAMMQTLYEKDELSESHSRTVEMYCEQMGEALGFSIEQIQELKTAGLLHDIGKTIVPDEILKKKTGLTDREYQEMKKHSEIGFRILNSLPDMGRIAQYVLHHHERYDGTGYPKKLSGESIPIQSRIISVVDAFVLMTVDKYYGIIMSEEEAIEELILHSGTQFDPVIVQQFIHMIQK